MNLRTALQTIHRDPEWWRKILIGGALMLTLVGYPWGAGLVVESLDFTRKGFPTPLPPWRAWGDRYVIGLFALPFAPETKGHPLPESERGFSH